MFDKSCQNELVNNCVTKIALVFMETPKFVLY